MNELLDLVRRLVREELALHRGPQLGVVTALYARESEDDTANYEVDVRLKHDGLALSKVPVAVQHIGVAAPPTEGDLVLVTFLDHDIQQPLVTGRFYDDRQRAPLFRKGDVLFEQRLEDDTINHLRMASDGSLILQRDVGTPFDNTAFAAGICITKDGVIEMKTCKDGRVELALTLDPESGIKLSGDELTITCDKLTIDGDVEMTKKLTVGGEGKISGVTISGTTIRGS